MKKEMGENSMMKKGTTLGKHGELVDIYACEKCGFKSTEDEGCLCEDVYGVENDRA